MTDISELQPVLERIAVGIEKLAEDPMLEIEAGPPVCPHCNRMNPEVATRDDGMRGPLFEFLLLTTCLHCHQQFYAIPLTYHCVKTRAEAEEEMQGRAGNGTSNAS